MENPKIPRNGPRDMDELSNSIFESVIFKHLKWNRHWTASLNWKRSSSKKSILDDHGLGEHDHAMIFIWIGLCSVLGIIWFLNDLRQRHIRQRKAISWLFLPNLFFFEIPLISWISQNFKIFIFRSKWSFWVENQEKI